MALEDERIESVLARTCENSSCCQISRASWARPRLAMRGYGSLYILLMTNTLDFFCVIRITKLQFKSKFQRHYTFPRETVVSNPSLRSALISTRYVKLFLLLQNPGTFSQAGWDEHLLCVTWKRTADTHDLSIHPPNPQRANLWFLLF